MMWDVEMEGKTGRMAHVFVLADNPVDAGVLAVEYFPELEITGNIQPVKTE